MSDWHWSAEEFEKVSDAVSGWSSLTALNLGCCEFNGVLDGIQTPWKILAQSLENSSSLQRLNVSDACCSTVAISSLLLPPLAMYHRSLRHLDLGSAISVCRETPTIASYLAELTNLTFLSLSSRFPAPEFAAALAQLVCLQHLDLCESILGSSPDVVMCISALTNLTALILASSGIDSNAIPLLASSLRSLSMLKHVDMSNNFVPCCSQLAGALATLSSLQIVELRDLELSEGESLECMNVLEHLPGLTLLDLNGSVPSGEHVCLHGRSWVHAEPSGTTLPW